MADQATGALPTTVSLTSWEYKEAIGLAVAASLVFALIEIPSRAKTTNLRATLVGANAAGLCRRCQNAVSSVGLLFLIIGVLWSVRV